MALGFFPADLDAADLLKILEPRLPVLINSMLTQFAPGIDPLYQRIASSSNVESSGFGRDLVVRKTFQGGVTGNVEMAQSDDWMFGQGAAFGAANKSWTYQGVTPDTYPDPLVGGRPKSYTMTIPLNAMNANVSFNLDEFRADNLPATIGEVIKPILTGFVQNILRKHCNMFYTTDSTDFAISGVETDISDGEHTDAVWVFAPNAPSNRYAVGELVDVYDGSTLCNSTDGTAATRITCIVDAVDHLYGQNGKVTLQLVSGTWYVTTHPGSSTVSNLKIVYRKNKALAFAGIESWLKTSGYLMGSSGTGIDVDDHPEFKSLGYTGSGALTEQTLRLLVTRFKTAFSQYGFRINDFIMTPGMFNAYAATKVGRETINRNGPLSLTGEGTKENLVFVHDGDTYRFNLSDWSAYGKLYGINSTAWKRYVPPNKGAHGASPDMGLQGASMPAFSEFEFVGKAIGYPSNLIPYIPAGGGVTKFLQAPGEARMQWCPSGQIPGIIASGFSEDRLSGA